MKQRLLILFITIVALSAVGEVLPDYEYRKTPYFKINLKTLQLNSWEYTPYVSSEIVKSIACKLDDTIWNNLLTGKSEIKIIIVIDSKGNVYCLINKSTNIPIEILSSLYQQIQKNKFVIRIDKGILENTTDYTSGINNYTKITVPLIFDPKSMIRNSKISPYYLQQVPDSLITKDLILKLSKEILAIPLKESHDLDSLMNVNPKEKDGFNH